MRKLLRELGARPAYRLKLMTKRLKVIRILTLMQQRARGPKQIKIVAKKEWGHRYQPERSDRISPKETKQ
jgi:hypothetical protein